MLCQFAFLFLKQLRASVETDPYLYFFSQNKDKIGFKNKSLPYEFRFMEDVF